MKLLSLNLDDDDDDDDDNEGERNTNPNSSDSLENMAADVDTKRSIFITLELENFPQIWHRHHRLPQVISVPYNVKVTLHLGAMTLWSWNNQGFWATYQE